MEKGEGTRRRGNGEGRVKQGSGKEEWRRKGNGKGGKEGKGSGKEGVRVEEGRKGAGSK
jgi:hypothetical protein